MLKTIGEVTIGQSAYKFFIDEQTAITSPGDVKYIFNPHLIIERWVYIFAKNLKGDIYEQPPKARLVLWDPLNYVQDENEKYVYAEEELGSVLNIYHRFVFKIKRGGYYNFELSDRRINKWLLVTENLFIDGRPVPEYKTYIGSGYPKAIAGHDSIVYFEVYNTRGQLDRVESLTPELEILDGDWTTPGKYRYYLKVRYTGNPWTLAYVKFYIDDQELETALYIGGE